MRDCKAKREYSLFLPALGFARLTQPTPLRSGVSSFPETFADNSQVSIQSPSSRCMRCSLGRADDSRYSSKQLAIRHVGQFLIIHYITLNPQHYIPHIPLRPVLNMEPKCQKKGAVRVLLKTNPAVGKSGKMVKFDCALGARTRRKEGLGA